MKPPTLILLQTAAGVYALVRGFQTIRNPSSDSSAFTPYVWFLFAGLLFFSAFDCYRKRGRTLVTTTTRLTRRESIAFKVLAAPTAVVGVVLLGMSCWMAWRSWITVARWPRANAMLVSKDISKAGARLVFRYEAQGQQYIGQAWRWGTPKAVEPALESYRPGTTREISYDPKDPEEIETNLRYNWEFFSVPAFSAIFGLALMAGSVSIYRWSYGWKAVSQRRD